MFIVIKWKKGLIFLFNISLNYSWGLKEKWRNVQGERCWGDWRSRRLRVSFLDCNCLPNALSPFLFFTDQCFFWIAWFSHRIDFLFTKCNRLINTLKIFVPLIFIFLVSLWLRNFPPPIDLLAPRWLGHSSAWPLAGLVFRSVDLPLNGCSQI